MFVERVESGIRIVTAEVGSSVFRIAPDAGMRLMQWEVRTRAGVRSVIYWPGDVACRGFGSVRGGNPLLFPFSGRSFHLGVEDRWMAPDGKVLPMPRHGFARDGLFHVLSTGAEPTLRGRLIPDARAAEAYPFQYRFEVEYRFSELAFTVSMILVNDDSVPLPWSAGHHFYFSLPWHTAARREDYVLHMDARKCAYHQHDGSLLMQRDREDCHHLGDPALIDRIHWELRHQRVFFGPKGGEEDVHIHFHSPLHKSYSIVTWSESPTAPYYCVEPWMGPPNAPGHGKGLHWVPPGGSMQFMVEVSLY